MSDVRHYVALMSAAHTEQLPKQLRFSKKSRAERLMHIYEANKPRFDARTKTFAFGPMATKMDFLWLVEQIVERCLVLKERDVQLLHFVGVILDDLEAHYPYSQGCPPDEVGTLTPQCFKNF